MAKKIIVVVVLLVCAFTTFAKGEYLQGHCLPAYFKTTVRLNLRETPNIKSKKMKTLPKNTEVYVTKMAGNVFCRVECGEENGYVSSEYLTFSRNEEKTKGSNWGGKLISKGGGMLEFLWNATVNCYKWVFDKIGNWIIVVGLILLIVGWKIMKEPLDIDRAIIFVVLMAILPVVIGIKDFSFYDPNSDKVWAWIGTVAIIVALICMVVSCIINVGFSGVWLGLLALIILYFGVIFFTMALIGIIILIVAGLFLSGAGVGRSSSGNSRSSNEISYTDSGEYIGVGGDHLPGEWGGDDQGSYLDDDTFEYNNGDKKYRGSDGEWHSWRES